MYSGIIQATLPIATLSRTGDLLTYSVVLTDELIVGVKLGASIAIDGCCQTVAKIEGNQVWFDAMGETLRVTNLGELTQGKLVHVERSLKMGDENGGHEISGHIDCTLSVAKVETTDSNYVITFQYTDAVAPYLFNKGFAALSGASLTVSDLDKEAKQFAVWLIPETLRLTKFGELAPGDTVNFEIERKTQTIVDTVERVLAERLLDGSHVRR